MVTGGSAALPDPSVRVLRGRAHGDLHLDNIIVSRWEKEVRADEYRLIDLCTFRDRAALGRDLATLLLSALVPHIRHPCRRTSATPCSGSWSTRPPRTAPRSCRRRRRGWPPSGTRRCGIMRERH